MFLTGSERQIINRAHVERVAYIECVIPQVCGIVVCVVADRLRCSARRLRSSSRFVRSRRDTEAPRKRVLRIQCQAVRQPPCQRELERIVTICAATALRVDFGKRILNRRAVDDGELSHGGHSDDLSCGIRAVHYTRVSGDRRRIEYRRCSGTESIGETAKEKVASLTAHVGRSHNHPVCKFLLN